MDATNTGCDDATIALQKGLVIVEFAREAASREDAIASAVAAVRSTGATVHRVVQGSLNSLIDIATK